MFGRDKMVFGGDKQSQVETCKIWYDKEVFVGSAVYKNVDNKIESLATNSIWMIGRAGQRQIEFRIEGQSTVD